MYDVSFDEMVTKVLYKVGARQRFCKWPQVTGDMIRPRHFMMKCVVLISGNYLCNLCLESFVC